MLAQVPRNRHVAMFGLTGLIVTAQSNASCGTYTHTQRGIHAHTHSYTLATHTHIQRPAIT